MLPFRERIGLTLFVAYLSVGLSQVSSQIFFLLVFRLLPVEAVGIYTLAIAVATIYVYVMDLGLATFLVGELSQHPYRLATVLWAILIVRLPVAVLGGLGIQVWAWLVRPAFVDYQIMVLVALTYFLQLLEVSAISWLQVQQQQIAVNLLSVVMPAGRLLGMLFLYWTGYEATLSYVGWLVFLTQSLSALCFLVVVLMSNSPAIIKIGVTLQEELHQLLQGFWSRGRKLTAMYALVAIQARADWLLVSGLLSKVALANYSLGNKVLELAMLLAGVGARTTFPWLSRTDAGDSFLGSRLALIRRGFVLLSVLICIGLFYWSPVLITLLLGNKYEEADLVVKMLTLGGAIFMLNQYLFYTVLAEKLEREYSGIVIAATLVQFIVDIILIPRLGLMGAVLGLLGMGVTLHVGQLGLLMRRTLLNVDEVIRLEIFMFVSIVFTAFLWLMNLNLVLATLTACGASLLLSRWLILDRDWAYITYSVPRLWNKVVDVTTQAFQAKS